MIKRTLLSLMTLAALAAAASPALAVDTVLEPGAVAQRMAALDGTIVWTSAGRLMQRGPTGIVAPVQGAPAGVYPSIDLGRDGSGELVLTYLRCSSAGSCRAYSDDLAGRHTAYKRLEPKHCRLSAAPSRWGSRVAYGLNCSHAGGRHGFDKKRSGLFVRKGAGAPRHLHLLANDVGGEAPYVSQVDLRGTVVGAIAAAQSDIDGFSLNIDGTHAHFTQITSSSGFLSQGTVGGMTLGAGGVLWTLLDEFWIDRSDAARPLQPSATKITRIDAAGCEDTELTGYAPTGNVMAVDGAAVYVYRPGTGIVVHRFDSGRFEPCG